MNPYTTPSPTEALLRRRLTEATRQSVATVAANLEALLSEAPLPIPAWDDLTRDEQLLHAAESVVALRAENAPDAEWTISVPVNDWNPVRIRGEMLAYDRDGDSDAFDPRAAAARWTRVLGASVEERHYTASQARLEVRGEYRGVPVRVETYAPTPAAATAAGGAR